MELPVVLYEQWRCGLIKKFGKGPTYGKASHRHLYLRVSSLRPQKVPGRCSESWTRNHELRLFCSASTSEGVTRELS